MKKYIISAALVLFSTAIFAQETYHIIGKMLAGEGQKIYLTSFDGGERVQDSSVVDQGVFCFHGTINDPGTFILSLEKQFVNKPLKTIFLSGDRYEITIDDKDIKSALVKGPKLQAEYALFSDN